MHICTIGMICSQQDQGSKWLLCMFSNNVTQLFSPDVIYVFCSNHVYITLSKCSNKFSFYWISLVIVSSFIVELWILVRIKSFLISRMKIILLKYYTFLHAKSYDHFWAPLSDTLCNSWYSSTFYILWHCNINDKCRKAKHLQKQISWWTVFGYTAI